MWNVETVEEKKARLERMEQIKKRLDELDEKIERERAREEKINFISAWFCVAGVLIIAAVGLIGPCFPNLFY